MIEKKQLPVKVQLLIHWLLHGDYFYPELQDIITHQLKLSEVVQGLSLVNNSSQSIKVVLLPDDL